LIVGRMAASERYKGHDLLLDIWPRVNESLPHARLVIVGDGDDRGRLQEKSAALGLADRVRFTGRIGDDALAALYRDAAMFVMPSRNEGLGLVFLEAMRSATPCIAAPGAAQEIIDDGINGRIVDPDDAGALVDTIVRLFVDEPARDLMGEAARRSVMERFRPDVFAARARELLGLQGVPVTC
jgi:glycosyltransferase involved in cell wall biosynthesis